MEFTDVIYQSTMAYLQQLVDFAYIKHEYDMENLDADEFADFKAYFDGMSAGKWFLFVNDQFFPQTEKAKWQQLLEGPPIKSVVMYTLKSAMPNY